MQQYQKNINKFKPQKRFNHKSKAAAFHPKNYKEKYFCLKIKSYFNSMLNSLDSTVSSTSTCSSVKEQNIKPRLHLDINYILEASKDPRDKWEQLEQNINEWLDEQNIYIVDPILKKKEYYLSLKQFAIEEQLRDEHHKTSLDTSPKRISGLKLDIEINCLQQRRGRLSHGIYPSSSF